jgi:3-deoxy-manno-octulosonate cytidylyltransferase (CMP-KDO synthetase)
MNEQASNKSRGVVVIPARLESTRLPRKLLLNETGQPLLAHVIGRAKEALEQSGGLFMEVVVACDDGQLLRIADDCGVRGVLTRAEHTCGTSRVAEAVCTLDLLSQCDFIVNLQADQPEIKSEALIRVAQDLIDDLDADITTLAIEVATDDRVSKNDRNTVKVVVDPRQRALYFSRAPIPDDGSMDWADHVIPWYYHIGVYAYRTDVLLELAGHPATSLERREGLEQLRALELGKVIRVRVLDQSFLSKGIDTWADYRDFVRSWTSQCRTS